jgi:RNA polymerase sigma-70 factor (ECF subfamily)
MSAEKLKEKILYLRLKKKDKEAFVKVYDLYFDDIYRFIYFKVSNKEEAEDISSSVFLKTWDYIQNNNLGEFKSLKPFLYQVARNAVIDYYRKKSSSENLSLDHKNNTIDVVDEKQNIEGEIDIKKEHENLMSGLKELKDEYREILIMRYVNELSISEISDALDKTKGNVRVIIYRAVQALREVVN